MDTLQETFLRGISFLICLVRSLRFGWPVSAAVALLYLQKGSANGCSVEKGSFIVFFSVLCLNPLPTIFYFSFRLISQGICHRFYKTVY